MKKIILLIASLLSVASFANVKISDLPLGSAALSNVNDSFPYVSVNTGSTNRMKLSDLINLPSMTSTYAKQLNPTFTGVVTAPSFVGPLTGNASTATALAANPTDCSGGQFANAIAANGNLTCSAVSSFSGSLSGDVTGTQGATVVSSVGGQSASNVATATSTVLTSQSAAQFLGSPSGAPGVPSYRQIVTSDISGSIGIAQGGTGQSTANAAFAALSPMTTDGDIITRSSGVPARVGIGSNGSVMKVVSGIPSWESQSGPTYFDYTNLVNPSSGVDTAFANGTQTITFPAVGFYRVILNVRMTHTSTFTGSRVYWTVGGTATRRDNLASANSDGVPSLDSYASFVLLFEATAVNQTATLLPRAIITYSAGTHTAYAQYQVTRVFY